MGMRWLAAVVVLGIATPAGAWEFGISDDGAAFWTVAEDTTGEVSLAFFCFQTLPGSILTQVLIDQPGPSTTVPVELGFEVAGRSFGPIDALAESVDGKLVVSSNGDDQLIGEAARSVYLAGETFALNYYESTWHFPGASQADAFSAVFDACG